MPQQLRSQQRLTYIDTAKGLGMLFVIFAHVNYTPQLLVPIYSFHMPLYFILSGMLFRRERYDSFPQFLKRRFQTLLIPYLILSLLSVAYGYWSEHLFPELFSISGKKYISYFLHIFTAPRSGLLINTPLWFVTCLFVVESIYFLLSGRKKWQIAGICFVLACTGWLLESGLLPFNNKLLPWSLDSGLFALSFYAFGNLFRDRICSAAHKLDTHPRRIPMCLGLLLLLLILWYPPMIANGKVTLGSKVLNNGFLFFLTGILGTFAILLVSLLLKKSRFLTFCGQNSFYLMSTHYMIRKFTLPKIYALLGIRLYDKTSLRETILPFILVLLLSLCTALVIRWIRVKWRSRHPLS